VVIATDGYVRVETEAFDLIRSRLGEANMFAFGIDSNVNRHIIEGMARVGMGEPFVITHPEEAPAQAKKFREFIQSPVLTDIRIDYKEFQVYDVEPLSVPDVMAERPVVVFGKWRGNPHGQVLVSGIGGKGRFKKRIDVARFNPSPAHSALRYLWARHRISLLSDYNRLSPSDERKAQVTNLGLTYNLLTAYTSFVAIDEQIRRIDGRLVTVKQPLPLSQGVSDLAVGGMSPTAASPMMALRGQNACKEAGPVGDSLRQEEKAKGRISILTVSVEGGVEVEPIRKLIEAHLPAMEKCFCNGSQSPNGGAANVILLLTIDSQGKINRISKEKHTLDKALEECLLRSIQGISFPAATDGAAAQVRVTLHIG